MSCKMCEKLLNVPADEKAIVQLFDESLNSIDANYFNGSMILDHYDNGKPFAFITFDLGINSTGRVYKRSIHINNCPFCGEKLK